MSTLAEAEVNDAKPSENIAQQPAQEVCTLAIDIGGTGLKATVLDENGRMIVERARVTASASSWGSSPKETARWAWLRVKLTSVTADSRPRNAEGRSTSTCIAELARSGD